MIIDSSNYFQVHENLTETCSRYMEHFNFLMSCNKLWDRDDSNYQQWQDEFNSYKVYDV